MGVIDVISFEGNNDVLIYKHPQSDFNLGSQLIVHESQEAVFFRDGRALESFGPGRHTLETQNVTGLKESINTLANGQSVFHSDVYFINLTTELGVRWGTDSKARMFDPISGLHIELGASGSFNIRIADGRKLLIKVVGTSSVFTQEDIFGSVGYATDSMIGKFRALIVSKVKTFLAKAIRENDIDILEIDEHTDELAEILRTEINRVLDEYGIYMPEFFITNIVTPDDDPNFIRLKEQHAERYLKIQDQRIIEAEARKIIAESDAQVIRTKGFAEADVLHAKGGDYQTETSRIVGKAAAENETASGAGSIVSDVVKAGVGIGVGVAVAKDVAGTVNGVVSNVNNSWCCPICNHVGNKAIFCENCGSKKPLSTLDWTCPNCGQHGLTTNFCPNCGHKRGE